MGKRSISLAIATFVLAGASDLHGQYPSTFQLFKDGTAIVIEDYAIVPPSSLMRNNPYPAPFDPRGQVSRVNALASEPGAAPMSAARFFVVDQNGVLYTLDKATKA